MLLAAGAALAQAPAAVAPPLQLRIVGGLASLNQFTLHEEPFWTRRLPALTEGRVRAEIVPFDRAGIRRQDMLRLLQLGVVPFGTALLSGTITEDPLVGLVDLPGANPDMATLRRAVAAFRPVLSAHLRQVHGVELLAVYAYPAQVLFCKQGFAKLADLAGRRIRVSSPPQADFIEALGATPVLAPFAELLPRLKAGQLDCAITGTMSGNTIGLHQATSHLHTLPITWGLSLFVANKLAWSSLPADLQQLLQRELGKLEESIWADAERETGEGIACNAGQAGCKPAQRGHMVIVQPSAADHDRLRALLASTVLPRWVARCGPRCAEAWDNTLAPVVGVRLRPAAR
jgi:TRAP-type C4-dicarboxylate transport system substrate-binding protein